MRTLLGLLFVLSLTGETPARGQSTIIPIEPHTPLAHREDRATARLVNTLVVIVRGKGLPCNTVSAAGVTPAGFKLVCDHLRHAYDIDVSGKDTVVTKGN